MNESSLNAGLGGFYYNEEVNMELFEVEVKTTVVVIAENSGDAAVKVRSEMPSIQRDQYFESRVVKSLRGEVLPAGWDGMCIPYGDTEGKTIKELCA